MYTGDSSFIYVGRKKPKDIRYKTNTLKIKFFHRSKRKCVDCYGGRRHLGIYSFSRKNYSNSKIQLYKLKDQAHFIKIWWEH